ncbi:hypothetical protein NQ318_019438 [Aromia moschata]|uniref:Tc1-like transposase DDE domain-containing protein n=1 Tax=Aromia moschata TaxID=1265417 RepID=A0AAV8XJQ2_9CUCU|nr:hypothetical protein NQ318_019438 [Aromia moschata]
MDESRFKHSSKEIAKNLASKGRKQVGAVSSAERGKHVTIVCAMNANGNICASCFYFPREKMKDELMNDNQVELYEASKENPVLLLLDGHSSHTGLQAMEFAKKNGIIIFCFPAHCSHHVQPLDVGFFRTPFTLITIRKLELWLQKQSGKSGNAI